MSVYLIVERADFTERYIASMVDVGLDVIL
jgi:hypothetical protein